MDLDKVVLQIKNSPGIEFNYTEKEWGLVSYYIDEIANSTGKENIENFLSVNKKNIDWSFVSQYYPFISIEFIETFKDYLSFNLIIKNKNITFNIIEKYLDEFYPEDLIIHLPEKHFEYFFKKIIDKYYQNKYTKYILIDNENTFFKFASMRETLPEPFLKKYHKKTKLERYFILYLSFPGYNKKIFGR